jgi:hypothetical protein
MLFTQMRSQYLAENKYVFIILHLSTHGIHSCLFTGSETEKVGTEVLI